MTAQPRQSYPSDLSDAQWNILAALIPPKVGRGETRKVNLREVVNAIFYQLRTGCQWDYLPHDFPPRDTVSYYFAQWREDGTLLLRRLSRFRKRPIGGRGQYSTF